MTRKLTLEMDLEMLSPVCAADQIGDAIAALEILRERLYKGDDEFTSDVILDSNDEDDLLGNWRID